MGSQLKKSGNAAMTWVQLSLKSEESPLNISLSWWKCPSTHTHTHTHTQWQSPHPRPSQSPDLTSWTPVPMGQRGLAWPSVLYGTIIQTVAQTHRINTNMLVLDSTCQQFEGDCCLNRAKRLFMGLIYKVSYILFCLADLAISLHLHLLGF